MATPKWQAGTLYPTGSLVQPLTGGGATSTAITNPGFEAGTTDWTLGPSMATDTANPYSGTNALRCTGTAGWNELVHDEVAVNPGQSITATCMYQQGGASTNQNTGRVFLRWYTSAMALISDSDGNLIVATEGDHYKQSTVTAIAPAGAAFVAIGGKTNRTNSPDSRFDNFAWNYAQAVAPAGLIYKAVQPTIGTSDATEPVWPLSVGLTVVDNTVIWEALIATRITYEASPILLSGNTEPTWPESIGDFVADNTISWKSVPQQVVEAPQSKVVTIASSKVYAADGDIVRYCATVNPLDWTTADDAGYLPTGLNQYGSNRTAVLNTYRGNVVPFSASTFLCYQADPDPANITQLDAMEGVGSTYQQAAHPVANDLFYLSPLGVRTVGIAVGTANLSAGDAGAPIDPLVQAAVRQATIDDSTPLSTYYPSAGQYWLAFPPPAVPTGPIVITGEFEDATIGVEYQGGPLTALNSFPPLHWEITALPAGLSMNISSVVTGTPTATGTVTGDVTVTDRYGRTATAPRAIKVIYGSPLAVGSTGFFSIYSGATSAYTLAQSLTLGIESATSVSATEGGSYVARASANSPYFRLFKQNELGAYTEVSTPLDTMPSAAVERVALTADGVYLATAQGTTWRLYKRSGDTFTLVQTVTGFSQCGDLKWTGDSEYLAGSSFSGVKVFRRAGDVLTLLTYAGSTGSTGIAWFGYRLAHAVSGDNQGVRVASVSGDTITTLANSSFSSPENARIRWSLDGQTLFMGGNSSGNRLRVYQWSGVAFSALTNPVAQPTAQIMSMDLSADGRVLSATCGEDGAQVRVYAVAGQSLTLLGVVGTDDATEGSSATFLDSSVHWT